MPRRLRAAIESARAAGGSIQGTSDLLASMLQELTDHGIRLSLQIGDRTVPVYLRIELPKEGIPNETP